MEQCTYACGGCGVHFWSELHLALVVDIGIRSMQVLCRESTPYLISCVLLTDTPCIRVSWGTDYSFPALTHPLQHKGCSLVGGDVCGDIVEAHCYVVATGK